MGYDHLPAAECERECYRRLDPHFEAPNQIKASAVDRGSMVRIPIGNEKSSRVEVRSVGPDANPYMVLYSIFKTGLHGETSKIKNLRQAERYLPDNIYTAIEDFRNSDVDDDAAGRRREGALCGPEAGLGGSLPAAAGNDREGVGSAVPSRGLQPAALEPVLASAYRQHRRAGGDRRPFRLLVLVNVAQCRDNRLTWPAFVATVFGGW